MGRSGEEPYTAQRPVQTVKRPAQKKYLLLGDLSVVEQFWIAPARVPRSDTANLGVEPEDLGVEPEDRSNNTLLESKFM